MQKDLARNVPDISPVSGKRPLEQLLRLCPVRCRILAGPVDVLGHRLALALLLNLVNVLGQFPVFLAFFPDLRPILVSRATDDIDCPFTATWLVIAQLKESRPENVPRIGALFDLLGAVRLEVLNHGFSLFADGTIVHRLAASGEEQQIVKLEQKFGTGLMDSRQDCLVIGNQLAQESTKIPCAL